MTDAERLTAAGWYVEPGADEWTGPGADLLHLPKWQAIAILDYVESAVKAERERCIRDICDLCHQRNPVKYVGRIERWCHENGEECEAHWIRVRGERSA